jgi:biotin carboxyl carrier protein
MPTREDVPAGEAPAGEAPAGEAPAGEAPAGEAPAGGGADSAGSLQARRNHEAIARLADDLLPALIAKLASSGLGEIEVREGGWKARLRMPAVAAVPAARAAESHAAHGTTRAAAAHSRTEDRDRRLRPEPDVVEEPGRVAAKSPAVGIYSPRRDLVVGMRVRAGDRIGSVNVLGVGQDVVSPVDGVIGSSLAEAGEAVEYGQDLVRIELPERIPSTEADAPAQVAVAGKA